MVQIIRRAAMLLLIGCFFVCFASYARADSSISITNGDTALVYEHGVCRMVNNSSGERIFVPLRSAGEWSAFRNNKPSDVNVNEPSGVGSGENCQFQARWSSWSGSCSSTGQNVTRALDCYIGSTSKEVGMGDCGNPKPDTENATCGKSWNYWYSGSCPSSVSYNGSCTWSPTGNSCGSSSTAQTCSCNCSTSCGSCTGGTKGAKDSGKKSCSSSCYWSPLGGSCGGSSWEESCTP